MRTQISFHYLDFWDGIIVDKERKMWALCGENVKIAFSLPENSNESLNELYNRMNICDGCKQKGDSKPLKREKSNRRIKFISNLDKKEELRYELEQRSKELQELELDLVKKSIRTIKNDMNRLF